MTIYELKHDNRTVPIDGELISDASSYEPGKMRWREIRIYRTSDLYVVEQVGRSRMPGETDRCKVYFFDTPADVEAGLTSVDKNGTEFLTIVAEDALTSAFSQRDLPANR